jgi:hypothetical protein
VASAWTVVSTAAFGAALYLVGVRSLALYLFTVSSYPFVLSLGNGQPDGLMALGAAVAWRYRDSWHGGAAAGGLIAAKLLAWPLVLWMLVTRRSRAAVVALGWALLLLMASWACVGFAGLGEYPRLLAVDAPAWAAGSDSPVAALMHLGVSESLASALTIALGGVVAALAFIVGRRSDGPWFASALAAGLLLSPMLRVSYLIVMFIPLAVTHPRLDRAWLPVVALWLSPPGVLPLGFRIGLVLLVITSLAIRATDCPTFDVKAPGIAANSSVRASG